MNDQVQITENDFVMINKALDKLLESDMVAEAMIEAMASKLAGGDPKLVELFKRERVKRKEESEKKMQLLTDDVRVLQAKLVTLKRLLVEKANQHTTDSILNFVK